MSRGPAWVTQNQADAAARRNGKQAYRCGYCLGLHIGSPDPAKVYPPRTVIEHR